ncbi:hypothetical protein P5673_002212 [Acropora cervicornis]|uniref:Uncharacterized protein n=1 Tax=Acropora cervicornis TaxID=6130 RepID=A0AAD9R4Y0_ACRCE|nr:hypothetical protein P5673_002212 [Acropora cervicornis]
MATTLLCNIAIVKCCCRIKKETEKIKIISVIALTSSGSLLGSSKSFWNISSPLNLRNSFCPMGNSLIRDERAYKAFFLTAMGLSLDNRRRNRSTKGIKYCNISDVINDTL